MNRLRDAWTRSAHLRLDSWRRRCRSRRTVLAVGFLDLRAHFLETLALIHHLHHVTRDADADRSAEAHTIEDRFFRR